MDSGVFFCANKDWKKQERLEASIFLGQKS
jgi:hypothetical protein